MGRQYGDCRAPNFGAAMNSWERPQLKELPRRLLFALGTIMLGVAGIFAAGDAVLAPAPISASPGFLETLLASRAVVAAVRIAAIFAAAFVVLSVVALVSRGQWPTRIGPVQIAEGVSDLGAENERLEVSLEDSRVTIENLRRELAASKHEPRSQ